MTTDDHFRQPNNVEVEQNQLVDDKIQNLEDDCGKKFGRCCLGCLEITLLIFALFFTLIRLLTLTAGSEAQLYPTAFPIGCFGPGSKQGCTRITLLKVDCNREFDLPTTVDSIVFTNYGSINELKTSLETCVSQIPGASLHSLTPQADDTIFFGHALV